MNSKELKQSYTNYKCTICGIKSKRHTVTVQTEDGHVLGSIEVTGTDYFHYKKWKEKPMGSSQWTEDSWLEKQEDLVIFCGPDCMLEWYASIPRK